MPFAYRLCPAYLSAVKDMKAYPITKADDTKWRFR